MIVYCVCLLRLTALYLRLFPQCPTNLDSAHPRLRVAPAKEAEITAAGWNLLAFHQHGKGSFID